MPRGNDINAIPRCVNTIQGVCSIPYKRDYYKPPTITLRDKLKFISCKDKHCVCRAVGFNCKNVEEQFQEEAFDFGVHAVAFATDLAYDNNPASREYEQRYSHIFMKKQFVPFSSKPIVYSQGSPNQSTRIVCQLKLINT